METVKARQSFPSGQILEISKGDITLTSADAIVNAANAQLMHGGGVAAAIVRRGGAVIPEESRDWVRKYGPVTHAKPAYTRAGKLNCQYVIHAVGPIMGEGDEDHKLKDAVEGSLCLAEELGLNTIALPAISTGIFGFPKERAASIFMETIENFCKSHLSSSLNKIMIMLFDDSTLEAFLNAFHNAFPNNPVQ